MQPVTADHQADVARWGTIEPYADVVMLLVDPYDRVAEQRLDCSVQRTIDRCRQIGAP